MSESVANSARKPSRIHPVSLIRGTMVATDLPITRRMAEELLGLEGVMVASDRLLLRERGHRPGEKKHGQPYWVLDVHQVDEVEVPQEMLNHWGVELNSQADVDRAYEICTERAEEFQLGRVQRPRFRNNS